MTRRRIVGRSAFLSAFLAGALALLSAGAPAQEPAAPQGPVYEAARQRVASDTTLSGILEPAECFEAKYDPRAFREAVRIREAAEPFSTVKEGDLLLSLERDAFDAEHAEARRALEEALNALTRAGATRTQHEVESAQSLARLRTAERQAQERLQAYEGWEAEARRRDIANDARGTEDSISDQEVELQQLEAMYAASELAHETRDLVLERARKRLARSRVSLEVVRASQRTYVEREHPHQLETLRQNTQKTATERAHEEALAPLRAAELDLAVEAARQALARRERRAAEMESDAARFEIRAPFAGLVLPGAASDRIDGTVGGLRGGADGLKPGTSVQAGQTVLSVVRAGPLRARMEISASRSGAATPGTAVTIRIADRPEISCAGTIASVDPIATREHSQTDRRICAVRTDLARGGLRAPEARPGCPVEVVVPGETWEALAVPRSCVEESGDGTACWVLAEGKAARRPLRLGRTTAVWAEILDGLG
ncbi:MAG: HlyD family efflux transporter periplasmic adaptor subunit [Planctomycetes bacterium]|nr:HlyD family efflux transporter periplasmic adaptor subunit [Planctomycetota bacterium]